MVPLLIGGCITCLLSVLGSLLCWSLYYVENLLKMEMSSSPDVAIVGGCILATLVCLAHYYFGVSRITWLLYKKQNSSHSDTIVWIVYCIISSSLFALCHLIWERVHWHAQAFLVMTLFHSWMHSNLLDTGSTTLGHQWYRQSPQHAKWPWNLVPTAEWWQLPTLHEK